MFLHFHVISRDHMIKEIWDLVNGTLTLSHHCAKFYAFRCYESEDVTFTIVI